MLPFKYSRLFRNRWAALLWSAGILWSAYQVAGPDGPEAPEAQAEQAAGNAALAQLPPEEQQAINQLANWGR